MVLRLLSFTTVHETIEFAMRLEVSYRIT